MTINSPNPGLYLQGVSNSVTNLRDNFQTILFQNAYLTSEGGATFLENTIGLSAADAATFVASLGNLAALAAIYQGGAPGAALNYQANSEPLWGGQ
jgi:hypothetical protein